MYIVKNVYSGNLRLNSDVGNFLISGDVASDSLRKGSSFVLHVHMKDFKMVEEAEVVFIGPDLKKYAPVGSGQGETDLPGFLSSLEKLRCEGLISMENEANGEEYINTQMRIERPSGYPAPIRG